LLPIIDHILYAQDKNEINNEKGGLILTLNKELVYQIYKEIKKIDIENRINVKRIGSLISNEVCLMIDRKHKMMKEFQRLFNGVKLIFSSQLLKCF
jgi:superfamily II DNA/RNA helicase